MSDSGDPRIDKAARYEPIDKSWIQRMVDAAKNLVSPQRPAAIDPNNPNKEPWFGPGRPQEPVAPKDQVAGRQFDFPVGVNTYARPRRLEPISFEQLRSLADSWDMLRLAIETRKDQLAKLEWSIMPRKQPDESFRRRPDDRCRAVEKFFRRPDKIHHWPDWVRMLAEDEMVLGAPSLYLRTDNEGNPWAAEPLDGATIMPILDGTGRRPISPDPAYAQVLKGIVAAQYTSEELKYFPRNPRTHKIYGLGIVEQILMTINIGLRRQTTQLETYTSGNVPDALIAVPETWSSQQIQEFQSYWDSILESSTSRRKAKFVPGGIVYQPTRGEGDGAQMSPFDEWLARVVCYAFSLPPLPFVRQMNRATAQTSYETALEEGLQPMMMWLKNAVDDLISDWFGYPDVELVWDNVRKLDPGDQAGQNLQFMQRGVKSLDEVRAEMGLEPLGLTHVVWGVGPLGFMSVKDCVKAIELGLTMPPSPMGPEGIDPMTGMPMMPQPMHGGEDPYADLMNQIPNEILSEVGLDEMGHLVEAGEGGEEGDDIERHAAHPEVAAALRDAEAMLGGR